MSDAQAYAPPKVWTWDKDNGGPFANINRPISGPTHDKELPVGRHPFQLYSLATPNGQKVTIMFEELLAAGHSDAEYDAWLINIGKGDQFGSGFVEREPEFENPRAARPQRAEAIPRVRVRRDPVAPRGKVRRLPAEDATAARGMPVVAVLADGQRAVSRRRLRALLRLCADQDRIRHQPLCDGSEAPHRRARQAAGGNRISRGRRLHDRRHRELAVVGQSRSVASNMAPASSSPCRTTRTCSAGPSRSARAPR